MLYKDLNRKWKVSRWSGAGPAAVAVQVMGEKGWWVEGCQGREIRKGAHCRPHTNSLLQFPFLIPSSSQHDILMPLCLWVFLQHFLFITHDLYVPIYPSLSSLLHWFSTYGSKVSSTSCRRFRRDGGCEWGEGFRFSPLSENWFFTNPTKCRTWILIPWTVSSSSSSSTCLLSPGGSWWGAGVQCFWRPETGRISACKMSRSSSSTSSGATSLFQQHCWYTIYKERAESSERICCCSVSTTLSRVEKRKNYCCLRLQAGG